MPGPEFVFGYGSLAALPPAPLSRERRPHGFVADLPGHRRCWGVAMDNRVDLPGYKHYLEADGERPAVFVSFLDLQPDPEASVNGVCLPVDADRLAALDVRERNYRRTDVTDLIDAGGARVWTYLGSPAGRERFATGTREGSALIDAVYRDAVAAAFARLGEAELELCRPSLRPFGLPVRALTRIDLR